MSMFYITLMFAMFATVNSRLIGNDPNTWSPKTIADNNIVIPSNTILGNNTDTWTPVTTDWTPIISYSSIILEDNFKDNLEDDLDELDKKNEQYKLPIVTINRSRDLDDEKLPKVISNIIDWFKGKNTRVQYNSRRLLL